MTNALRAAVLALTLTLFLPCAPLLAQTGAMASLQKCVDEILVILRDPALKGESQKAKQREMLIVTIKKIFEPSELAQRALGPNWVKFSPEQQKEFVQSFNDLLNRTYLDRIQAYSDEKVVYLTENSLGPDKSEVQTKVVTAKNEIPINYRMLKKGEWKVYDVVIEGVSLVQNYRNQFNEILMKETPEKLLDKVKNKL